MLTDDFFGRTMAIPFFDAAATARLLSFADLVGALRIASTELQAGRIVSPERTTLPLQDGAVMLAMPATAPDIAIHKLVTVCPGNMARGLATIQGQVAAYDPHNGLPLFMLDGPTVTARRTAAMSMLGIQSLHGIAPGEVLVIGTGAQACTHVAALGALFPAARVYVIGSSFERAEAFCLRNQTLKARLEALRPDLIPASVEVVITATSSHTPVYHEPDMPGRLVIAVGSFTPDAAEVATTLVQGSVLYIDDLHGGRYEAGDFIQAGTDWARVHPIADAFSHAVPVERPILFKTVGCAAWDLAACRVARLGL